MPSLPHRPQLERMIAQAMKDRAPKLYRDLRDSGSLAAVVTERAEVAEEIYELTMSRRYQILQRNNDHQETVKALSGLRTRASEAAIEAAVEFGST